jgi:hypothetical protein
MRPPRRRRTRWRVDSYKHEYVSHFPWFLSSNNPSSVQNPRASSFSFGSSKAWWPFPVSAYLLDIVVRECAAILKLLASKDEALLVGRDALLVLNLRLHIVNRVRGLDLQRDSLAGEGLDETIARKFEIRGQQLCRSELSAPFETYICTEKTVSTSVRHTYIYTILNFTYSCLVICGT